MQINKKYENVIATVYYEAKYDGLACDDTIAEEEIKVKDFADLLLHLGEFGINKIREEHDGADSIRVVGISIHSKADSENSMGVNLFKDQGFHAWSTTTIENKDIDNRAVENLYKLKEIIDNTLEGYPTRY